MQDLTKPFHDKNVMITGGLGFIGSNLAIRLASAGARVTVVDSLIDDYGGNLFNLHGYEDRLRINIADVRTRSTMNYLVRGQHYIFNLAGQVSHIDSMENPYNDLEINCISQLSLLEACRRFNPGVKIVFAGTRQQYGKPQYLPVDERHLMLPTDVNGINKMAGEMYHLLYNNVYGIRACSLRLTNTYGPRMLMKHNRQGFIGVFIRQAINGECIKLFGDGKQRRDYNYVDDVVDAFLLAAADDRANGEAFNLGGLEVFSLLRFVEILLEITGSGSYEIVPFPEEKKRIDIGDYYGNYEKIRSLLGWEPQVRLREGLERTVEYFRNYKQYYWPKHENSLS
ncbi:MAG: NAD-dependent epimerase/dehydratase family protein [candidate division KSB1 bacterium]|nr:NAD-dependent epimerase/dehydratase family protein [candidate division KSB1 bacterium]MDZ7275979.1 NAD-dependent epimerase/dehydratase family protein [candidate division KSB1 bacterium]MDZ7285739.1 NAD-dependent epimerase/dehydratase family protein [candidate division KSB1 bacterium]MDZ7298771.1 NAD-dependent epimerase/dehydratase family protein [candidate division KSB1 bacterium]MDZ7305954.1 NAD-dependent epimerase/dehydratase family protein [candidate division KSB1 bacterium]